MSRTILSALFLAYFLFPTSLLADVEEAKRNARNLSIAFESVASTITPAVVNIKASVKLRKTSRKTQLPPNIPAPFRDFFEKFGHELPFNGNPSPRAGLGSGVIVDDDGHILTNNHVVEGADEVRVNMSDGQSFEAKIVGTDPRTDLAVIKIDAEDISPATLGNSDDLKIGEWVLAAGTPFGLENTITSGIVSAKGRSIMGGNAYEDFIQTDAAINPGNSGGPLVNLDGEVVGINTAIFSRTGGYMGIGFAIPINMAKEVMESLIKDGKVTRGWLGVSIQELDEELAASFNYPSKNGALIAEVAEGSPAEDSGLEQGDIIISFNRKTIREVNDLRNYVAAEAPNTLHPVTVIREGRKKTFRVKLGELPANLGMEQIVSEEKEELFNELGLSLKTLNSELRKKLKPRTDYGVYVEGVVPESLAAKSGLKPGDIIFKVKNEKVKSVTEFEKAVRESALKKGVRLIVETRGMDRFVVLKER